MIDAWDRSAIAASLSGNGFLRRSPWPHGGRAGHREWLHFTVIADDLRIVINLSIVDDVRPAAEAHRERVRVVVLVHDATGWHGGVDEIASAIIPGGQLAADLGQLAVASEGDRITVRGGLRSEAIELDLTFTARTFPSLASAVAIGGGAPINWLVVPRLDVTGHASFRGRLYMLDRAVGYHDHNWGSFSQRDLAWQWGHDGARGRHQVVLARVLDRAQTATYMQALLAWTDGRQARVFRGDELAVASEGFLRPGRPVTIPRTAALLAGDSATEIPRRLHIRAAASDDRIEGVFEAASVARIVVPDDDCLETTAIHEVEGVLRLRGSLRDEPFQLEAPAMFEFLQEIR